VGLTDKEVQVLQLRNLGLTQLEVAKKIKVTQAAVSAFERSAYRKLADAQAMLEFAKNEKLAIPSTPTYKRGVYK
jgi:transcriptional regulator